MVERGSRFVLKQWLGNRSGFGMIEAIIAAAIFVVIATVVASYISSNRTQMSRLADSQACNTQANNLILAVKTVDNALQVRSLASEGQEGKTTATNDAEDLFCNESLGIGNLLCDSLQNYRTEDNSEDGYVVRSSTEANHYLLGTKQNIQGAATWAMTLFNNCVSGDTQRCPLTGDICNGIEFVQGGSGLNNITSLSSILPSTFNVDNTLKKVKLKILPADGSCSTFNSYQRGGTFDISAEVTIGRESASVDDSTNRTCTAQTRVSYHSDYSQPRVILQDGDPNQNIIGNPFRIYRLLPGSRQTDANGNNSICTNPDLIFEYYDFNNNMRIPYSPQVPCNPAQDLNSPIAYTTQPIDYDPANPPNICNTLNSPIPGVCTTPQRTVIIEIGVNEPSSLIFCHRYNQDDTDNNAATGLKYRFCSTIGLDGSPNLGRLEFLSYALTLNEPFRDRINQRGISSNRPIKFRYRWDNMDNGNYHIALFPVDSSGNGATQPVEVRFQVNGPLPNAPPSTCGPCTNHCDGVLYADTAGEMRCRGCLDYCSIYRNRCPAGTVGAITSPPYPGPQVPNTCDPNQTLCPIDYTPGQGCNLQSGTYCGGNGPVDRCGEPCPSATCSCPQPDLSNVCPSSSVADACGTLWPGQKNGCTNARMQNYCPSETVIGECGENCGPGQFPPQSDCPDPTTYCPSEGREDRCGNACPTGTKTVGCTASCNACTDPAQDNAFPTDNGASGKSFVRLLHAYPPQQELEPHFAANTGQIFCSPGTTCTGAPYDGGLNLYTGDVTFNVGRIWTEPNKKNEVRLGFFLRFIVGGTCSWYPEVLGDGSLRSNHGATYNVDGPGYDSSIDCVEWTPTSCVPTGTRHSITGINGDCANNGTGIVLTRPDNSNQCEPFSQQITGQMMRRVPVGAVPSGPFGRQYRIIGEICNTDDIAGVPTPPPPPVNVPPPTTPPPAGGSCVPDCSAAKMSNYGSCVNVPDGCGGQCGPGTRPACSPLDAPSCGTWRDYCNNSCDTGVTCTVPQTCPVADCSINRTNLFCPGQPVPTGLPEGCQQLCPGTGTRSGVGCPAPGTFTEGTAWDDCGNPCPGGNVVPSCYDECNVDSDCGVPASVDCTSFYYCDSAKYRCETSSTSSCKVCVFDSVCPACLEADIAY